MTYIRKFEWENISLHLPVIQSGLKFHMIFQNQKAKIANDC